MRTARPDPVDYMLQVARTPAGAAYKAHVLSELDLTPGTVVLDVGCGPGTDLAAMGGCVAPAGLTLGLDLDAQMLSAAARMVPAGVVLAAGDAHRLPLASGAVDRVRADRSLQHVLDLRRVLAEFFRVLRPGGFAVIAEPDWGTLVIDAGRSDVSQRFVDYTCREVVRNAIVGRQIARLGMQAGFAGADVVAFPIVFRDFAKADEILGLTRNALAAVDNEYLERHDADAWIGQLSTQPMLAAATLFVTTLTKPAAGEALG